MCVSKVHLFFLLIFRYIYWYFTAVFSIYTSNFANILYINSGWKFGDLFNHQCLLCLNIRNEPILNDTVVDSQS